MATEEILLATGFGIALLSQLFFRINMSRLNNYLRENHEDLWARWGSGNRDLIWLARHNRLRQLAIGYEVDDHLLNRKLLSVDYSHKGLYVGLSFVLLSVAIYVLSAT